VKQFTKSNANLHVRKKIHTFFDEAMLYFFITVIVFFNFCQCGYELLGVPYAQPPVGALRWKLPQPPSTPFVLSKHVNQLSPVCTQEMSPKIMHDYTFPNGMTAGLGAISFFLVYIMFDSHSYMQAPSCRRTVSI
jgi:hypothetical protein